MIQAAHIVPVHHEGSTDQNANGMALCALHHYAYDRGLVYVDEEYAVEVNQRKVEKFQLVSRDGGLDEFTEALRALIVLPPAISDRPHVAYLRLANSLRLAIS